MLDDAAYLVVESSEVLDGRQLPIGAHLAAVVCTDTRDMIGAPSVRCISWPPRTRADGAAVGSSRAGGPRRLPRDGRGRPHHTQVMVRESVT